MDTRDKRITLILNKIIIIDLSKLTKKLLYVLYFVQNIVKPIMDSVAIHFVPHIS